jgi:hypothetical protein
MKRLAVDLLLPRFYLGRLELKRECLLAFVVLIAPAIQLLFELLGAIDNTRTRLVASTVYKLF